MAERDGGDSSEDEGDVAQTVGRTIWDRDDGLQRSEDGYQQLTVKAAFFYADYRVVEYTDPGWLQLAFDTLMGIFDRVVLWTNVHKTVGVVCIPCRAAGVRVDEAYTRRMTGEGWSFKEGQRERVLYLDYGKEMAKGSPVTHRQTQHGMVKGG